MNHQHTVTVADNNIVLDTQDDRQVDIRLAPARLENSSCGETVARLVVEREDGQQAIFFVVLRLNKRGVPSTEIIAKKPNGTEVRKSVQGYWKPPHWQKPTTVGSAST